MGASLRCRHGNPWYLGEPDDVHGWLPGLYRVSVRCLRVSELFLTGCTLPIADSVLRPLQNQSRALCLGPEIRVFVDDAG